MTPEQEEKLERIRFADRAYTEDDLRRADSHCPRDRRDLLGIVDAIRSELARSKGEAAAERIELRSDLAVTEGDLADAIRHKLHFEQALIAANARAERLEAERDEARELVRVAHSKRRGDPVADCCDFCNALIKWAAEAQPPAEPTCKQCKGTGHCASGPCWTCGGKEPAEPSPPTAGEGSCCSVVACLKHGTQMSLDCEVRRGFGPPFERAKVKA